MQSLGVKILLVDDDMGDIELTQKTLYKSQFKIHLHVVNDGEEALDYLCRERPSTQTIRPNLILLDINLPGFSGLEILSAIKTDNRCKSIPVVILSSSDAETDILKSYELGANWYITKPIGLNEFLKIIDAL